MSGTLDLAQNFESEKKKPSVLSLTIKDKSVLFAAYMSTIKNGGIFIPTPRDYVMGEEVYVQLSLMEDSEKLSTPTRVIWITPKGAHGNKVPGIGVQFMDEGAMVRSKIETHLAGMLQSEKPTHTL